MQCRQTYGKDSPILASVATKVYYTPADQETADDLSEQLGVSTERLHPESQTFSFWGMLRSTSVGTSEHERRLLTADECRRLDESAMVCIVKGLAPIMGTKLGSPAPVVVDLAKPMLKRVAAVAGALLMLIGGSVGAWALWPRPETPAPRLSLTPETPVVATLTPETPARQSWGDWWAERNAPTPWELSEVRQMVAHGKLSAGSTHRTISRLTTEALCEASKAKHVQWIQSMQINTPNMTFEPWGYRHNISPKHEHQTVVVCTSAPNFHPEPVALPMSSVAAIPPPMTPTTPEPTCPFGRYEKGDFGYGWPGSDNCKPDPSTLIDTPEKAKAASEEVFKSWPSGKAKK